MNGHVADLNGQAAEATSLGRSGNFA